MIESVLFTISLFSVYVSVPLSLQPPPPAFRCFSSFLPGLVLGARVCKVVVAVSDGKGVLLLLLRLSLCRTSALIFSFFRAPKGEPRAPSGTAALSQAWSSGIPSFIQSSHRRCCPRLRPPVWREREVRNGTKFCPSVMQLDLANERVRPAPAKHSGESKRPNQKNICPARVAPASSARVHTLYRRTRVAHG